MIDTGVVYILRPCAAMVAVTAVVWIKLYADRLGEMRRRRIDPQSLAAATARTEILKNTAAADNFRNLFEVPVLFYALCLAVAVAGVATPGLVAAAWLFVALRAIHSLIHVTYNRVVHRFAAYALSTLLLFGMWAAVALELASAGS